MIPCGKRNLFLSRLSCGHIWGFLLHDWTLSCTGSLVLVLVLVVLVVLVTFGSTRGSWQCRWKVEGKDEEQRQSLHLTQFSQKLHCQRKEMCKILCQPGESNQVHSDKIGKKMREWWRKAGREGVQATCSCEVVAVSGCRGHSTLPALYSFPLRQP